MFDCNSSWSVNPARQLQQKKEEIGFDNEPGSHVSTSLRLWMRFNVVGLFGHFLLFPLNRISAVMLAAIVIAAKTPSSELPSPDYDLALWRPSAGEEYRNRNAL